MGFPPTIQCHRRIQKTFSRRSKKNAQRFALSRRVCENKAVRRNPAALHSLGPPKNDITNFHRNHSLSFSKRFVPTQINIRFRMNFPRPKSHAKRETLPTNSHANNKQIHSNGIYECELREMRRVKRISSHGLGHCIDKSYTYAECVPFNIFPILIYCQ